MTKKESYKHNLPHFQQPGQAYFITWILKYAATGKAFSLYPQILEMLRNQICLMKDAKSSEEKINAAKKEYFVIRNQYLKTFDSLLDKNRKSEIDLSKPWNLAIMREALLFWEGKKLKNIAFSIMPNHVHWVIELLKTDDAGKPVYLQDIMHSVKRQTANHINKANNRTGTLWQKESFDITIRNEKHLYYSIEYTLNNPVKAGLVQDRDTWPGNYFGIGIGGF